MDILADGRLDLEESTLAALDFVVASVHSAFDQTAEAMTVRVLTAMACPFVDAIGHPTGRKILRREPHRIDIEALIEAAGLYGIALEINSNYHRLDLSDVHARRAKAQGVGHPDRQRRALDHRARPAALGRADGAAGVAGARRRLEHPRRRRLPQRPAPASPAGGVAPKTGRAR